MLKLWIGDRSLGWHLFGLIAYWLLWVSLTVLALLLVTALAFHISLGIALPFGR